MPNACFIDTNLLLYSQDPNEPEKAQRVAEWLGALADLNAIIISPQVAKEYAHNIIRRFQHVTAERLLAELAIMQPWCRAPTTYRTAMDGLKIHYRYKFSYYDSCLIASALEYGCDMFLTEDMSHQQKIGDMRIVNPFAGEPYAFIERN